MSDPGHAAGRSKRAIIESISFGGRIAEDEAEHLARYFVETEQWRKVWEDEVDIIFAPKGGGKSAIYSMLASREDELFDRSIVLIPGENPVGKPAFSGMDQEGPASEQQFVKIWQLYFLALIADHLREFEIKDALFQDLMVALESAGLAGTFKTKTTLVSWVLNTLKRFFTPESVEGGLQLDPVSGAVIGFSNKIAFHDPSPGEAREGIVSIDSLFEDINTILEDNNLTVWLILDRLDVAFAASPELEKNALRALFRVYSNIKALPRLRLKIFLRSDIWNDITADGFREISHITRDLTIDWTRANLLKLIVQRTLNNPLLVKDVNVDPELTIASSIAQQEFFDKVFPKQVDSGSRKSATFDWVLARIKDGRGVAAPRELIHIFTEMRDAQLSRLDIGQSSIESSSYFEPLAFRDALPVVSKARLEKTIYPEFPWAREWLESMEGQKTRHDLTSLAEIWGVDDSEADERVRRLLDIGFFEQRGDRTYPVYFVPFIYRPALNMIQGASDGLKERMGEMEEDGSESEDDGALGADG